MGWNSELTAASAVGDMATYSPDTSEAHGYTAASFTAPKKGIYRFTLRGSGGDVRTELMDSPGASVSAGGAGGLTDGYLLLESRQTVFIGCGGPCSAAWVASVNPGNAGVSDIPQESLYFVAGGGGGGGAGWGQDYNMKSTTGGAGGGISGAGSVIGENGTGTSCASGGTQSGGGAAATGWSDNGADGSYGTGGRGSYANSDDASGQAGDGGDGYYGGGSGCSTGGVGIGGGGGSGYVIAWAAAGMTVGGTTYFSTTQQGGGAASGGAGSVTVTYHAEAELPVIFNGTRLTEVIFNGTKVTGLIYNGTTVFAGRCRACLKRRAARFACLRAIRASLALGWRAYRWERMTSLSSPCASRMASL